MKYARSTLATTVLAVFGLGVAAQNLHSHDRDAQTRPIAASAPITPVAWVDPPARTAPETTGALPKAPAAAAIPTAAPAEPLAKPVAIRREKGAERSRIAHLRRSAHSRTAQAHTAQARTAAADPGAMPRSEARPAPDTAGRIDPIGDILRGLGFGRDS